MEENQDINSIELTPKKIRENLYFKIKFGIIAPIILLVAIIILLGLLIFLWPFVKILL